jgi:hypothetical protein
MQSVGYTVPLFYPSAFTQDQRRPALRAVYELLVAGVLSFLFLLDLSVMQEPRQEGRQDEK